MDREFHTFLREREEKTEEELTLCEQDRMQESWDAAWQAAQPQWQPIETAPRDGSPVLVCNAFASWESCYSGYWLPSRFLTTGQDNPTH